MVTSKKQGVVILSKIYKIEVLCSDSPEPDEESDDDDSGDINNGPDPYGTC